MQAFKGTILVVEDGPDHLELLRLILTEHGYEVEAATDGASALALANASNNPPDLILLDINLPDVDGYTICQQLKAQPETEGIPVIFISGLEEPEDKVSAFKVGGIDYITKPFYAPEVIARIDSQITLRRLYQTLQQEIDSRTQAEAEVRALNNQLEQRVQERTEQLSKALSELELLKNRLQEEASYLREEIAADHNTDDIIGQSTTLKKVLTKIQQVSTTDATVLVLGETGTGKELIARAIHNASHRRERPLVKVNCAALPPNLIESELFGHEKGSFTGALQKKIGRFELADGGSIFLDEIGDLALDLQAKLLRVLQEGEFERLGGSKTLAVDVRVIAATNRNLPQLIEDDQFREDLYYRLNVFPINLPPLREREGDIPLLAQAFVNKFAKKMGRKITSISDDVITTLQNYSWPGNIRELQNFIERAVILSQGSALEIDDTLTNKQAKTLATKGSAKTTQTLEDVERQHIINALEETNWKISGAQGAAQRLGINPSTLRSRMQKLAITPDTVKQAS